MAMGRQPKPTHLKLVTGNPGRRPLPVVEAQAAPEFARATVAELLRRLFSPGGYAGWFRR